MRVTMITDCPDFDKLNGLINRIQKQSIIENNMAFENYSTYFARLINSQIFGNDDHIPFRTHTLVSIGKTRPDLDIDTAHAYKKHMHSRLIVSLLTNKAYSDMHTMPDEYVNKMLTYRLDPKSTRLRQLLFFQPDRTFLYPSPSWMKELFTQPGVLNTSMLEKLKCR
jgi:hypothetical protein